jgi:serralysin
MAYEIIPDLPLLDEADMDLAAHLLFGPRLDDDGYENQAGVHGSADFLFPVFSFSAVEGALYTVTADSWFDPWHLVLYDGQGLPIAEDDGWGALGQDGLSFIAPYSGTYFVDASWSTSAAHRDVALTVVEDLDAAPTQVGEGTASDDEITGTAANDALYGHAGWDLLIGDGGADLLDGGSGTDTAWYEGKLEDYDVINTGHRLYVTDFVGLDGEDTLVSVERLDFADVALAFDVDGSAGEAYRLYQAAFSRAPDEAGLGFWIAFLDAGVSLRDVAAGFINSDEFRALHGSGTSTDYTAIVTSFYENGLGRAPEAAGLAHWVNILATGQDTLAGVLVGFSESDENYSQLIGVMDDGMAYQVWA